jgi:hypothetical protein
MKHNFIFLLVGLVVGAALVSLFGGATGFGGTTNYDALDVTDGYYVDGTVRIDGSGYGQFSSAFASTSVVTTLLTVSGTTTLSGAATTTISNNLRFADVSEGIVLKNASSVCNLVYLDNSMNLATSTASCN